MEEYVSKQYPGFNPVDALAQMINDPQFADLPERATWIMNYCKLVGYPRAEYRKYKIGELANYLKKLELSMPVVIRTDEARALVRLAKEYAALGQLANLIETVQKLAEATGVKPP